MGLCLDMSPISHMKINLKTGLNQSCYKRIKKVYQPGKRHAIVQNIKQDRSKTCFTTVVNFWFAIPPYCKIKNKRGWGGFCRSSMFYFLSNKGFVLAEYVLS